MNRLNVLTYLWVCTGILGANLGNALIQMDHPRMEDVYEVSYLETLDEVDNPGRGFYAPVYVHYLPSGNQVPEFDEKLLHLRLDLAEFSGAYNKQGDAELSADMLAALDETLAQMERIQSSAVIRFSYDPWFSGKKTYEPAMDVILRHQEQLGEVLSRHEDAVLSVECGMFGKWGEMHGSDACTQENFNAVIDQWLGVLPESISISVRTPGQYCGWCGTSRSELAGQITVKGQKEYRVGIYDDGYLGSETDLGTYVDRAAEVKWLSNQAKHTVFGGEAGTDGGKHGEVGFTTEFLEKEAFLTHTTYLNIEWNQKLINHLKKETYQGSEERYQGTDGYVYLKNHLGYRFVERSLKMTTEVPLGQIFRFELQVENVGFANLVKPKDVTLILVKGDRARVIQLNDLNEGKNVQAKNCDPTAWDSKEITTMRVSFPLEENLLTGEYQVYLRIASPSKTGELGQTGYPVQFANEGDNVWDPYLGANYLGTIRITEPQKKYEWSPEEGIRLEK